ncbi:galactose mutarotase [Pyrrhoderma noxium]|uniref:Galactose mutarotase n=1 Tax=Pyrrhoderma noxium TaxID=2282107 RepID=A0A286U7P6_9AGAM|nr:galactose mutarotase [Pyrrhoderma noxium]
MTWQVRPFKELRSPQDSRVLYTKFIQTSYTRMKNFLLLFLASLLVSLSCVSAEKWPFDVTTISAPDDSIIVKFVSFGSTMTELWVKDKFGQYRDVILGYDDNTKLLTDSAHPVFNPIVGRYANRIKNGTFSIPITKDPQPDGPDVYHIPTNDHDGQDTLHGGIYGWDRRNWTIVEKSRERVTYKHIDTADEGFPGNVTVYATHAVKSGGILETSIRADATDQTPIMTTQHIYWNLDAFQQGSEDILNHILMVSSSKVVATDANAIPTGDFIPVEGGMFDFRRAKKISSNWDQTIGACGEGCQGYDNCFIFDNEEDTHAKVSLWSNLSGIRLDVTTDQPAVQVYTGFWLNTPRKAVHGGPELNYTKWSAVAIEQEGYIDAINTPEWGVNQIYGPGEEFVWKTRYEFSVIS